MFIAGTAMKQGVRIQLVANIGAIGRLTPQLNNGLTES
jgi:hypothetical protein